jgi:signal transduction histidine kinase
MNRQNLLAYTYFAASAITLVILIALTIADPPSFSQLLPALLFCGLVVFTDAFGIRLPTGMVSLLPTMTIAAYLVTGLAPAGWAAFVGTVIYSWIRGRWGKELHFPASGSRRGFASLMAVNATMHTGSILIGGAAYQMLGGSLPLEGVTVGDLPALLALAVSYLAFNHSTAGLVIAARSNDEIKRYIRSLPNLLLYEGGPLLFAPLVALIYTQLGIIQFLLFSSLIVITSLTTRSLALTSGRLERRVKELGSLQAVGRALSASLNIDVILSAIHKQVAALMPARNFYVALYDVETDEVSFPLAIEDEQRVTWRSRRAGSGLTEHILETRQPLLLRGDITKMLAKMGIEHIGKTAASWLGVPILAEQEPIGVIAIQSYTTPMAYDISHQEVLVTIAAQAAVAIQNARLYEQTDEALALRVQELASILHTTGDGILLLDADYRVLAVNRALANFLGIAQAEITNHQLGAVELGEDTSLLAMIGFNDIQTLVHACEEIREDGGHHKQIVLVQGPPKRHLERTLTPVRGEDSAITGWLFVFRDISEEIKLAQLREDMMHMLVHDLRSPLTLLQGSLDMMAPAIKDGKLNKANLLVQMARRGSDRMLRMVNELLDISKLESGELVIHPEIVNPEALFREITARLEPLTQKAHITINLNMAQETPSLYVDAKLVERVLHNLVDNAIKFTPDHGTVQLWAKSDPENADWLRLGVTDTGPGIPPEERPRLFEKFQQTSVTGRRVGTGLGLPFCKLAVEAHGGQIWIESEVGAGSTFIMRLPTAAVKE